MESLAKKYFDDEIQRLQVIAEEEMSAINEGAMLLSDAIANGKRIFAFGCTHSSLPIQDLVYRAGASF